MKTIVLLHRYLSLLLAPIMLAFAVSGAWQAFRFNDSKKDGSYRAPVALSTISQLHKADDLKGPTALVFKAFQVVVAAAFAAVALLGFLMAFRGPRAKTAVWVCLLLGTLIPAALAVFALG
jgi:hypothetical protein